MKVEGYHFKRAMNNNIITIIDDVIQIHSYDDIGSGIIRKEKLEFLQNGELHFILNKKDFNLLRSFNEIDITVDGETICAQAGKTKLKFQNQKEVKEYQPDLTDPTDLDLPIEILAAASEFVGDTDRMRGVLVTPGTVLASDSKSLYRFDIKTKLDHKISVPTEILKLLDKESGYEAKLCGKMIVMMGAGEIVYSTLIEGFVDTLDKLEFESKDYIEIKKEEFLHHMNLALNFSEIGDFEIIDDKRLMINSVLIDGQVSSYSAETEAKSTIKKTENCYSIKNMIKVAKNAKDIVKLRIHHDAYFIQEDGMTALTMAVRVHKKKEENA